MKVGAPVVGFNDSGGAYTRRSYQPCRLRRNISTQCFSIGSDSQISAFWSLGGAVYSPALTDFIMMVKNKSYMFVTGPKVVKTVTGEDVTVEELGGATMHATKSGVAQLVAENEEEGIKTIKRLLSFLPSNNMESPPEIEPTDPIERVDNALNEIIPDSPKTPYDMKRVINSIIDNEDFLEILPDYAKNIIVGFARMGGMPVGIVADQPLHLAGVLDINASRKGARFVRFCDAFNIPLITLVDVPGFLPSGQEYGGLILHGAKLLYAYGEATVPRLTVILRKNYGGAYCVMSSKHMRGDINYAWPTAEIAVMGGKGAIEILMSKEIKKIEDADKLAEFMDTKEAEYREQFANPYVAAKYGYLDDIIEPRNTRYRLIKALKSLQSKRLENPPKKHDNLPL